MILIIDGDDLQAKRLLANKLRNTQISQGSGALLVLETEQGEPQHMLEKIIYAQPFIPGQPIHEIPWKPAPAIIVLSEKEHMIEVFETMVPGFIQYFGPIQRTMASEKKKTLLSRILGG